MTTIDPTAAALSLAVHLHPDQETPRLMLADYWQEQGRDDVAAMWRGDLPVRSKTRQRVDTLTAAETAAMKPWVKKWVAIGLSTQPADRPLFEAAATQCYLAAGLKPPRFAWCESPLVVVAAATRYQIVKKTSAQVLAQVLAQVRAQVHDQVSAQVLAQVRDQVRDQVSDQVSDQVHDQVSAQVHAQVRAQVRDQVGDQVGDQVRDQVGELWHHYFGGQFWVGWYYWLGSPSTTTFCLDVLRLRLTPKIELAARAYAATAASACWWYPTTDVCFVSERPHTLEVRPGKSPLVLWDGWGIGN